MNGCYTDIVGALGLCDGIDYKYLLDDIGVGLKDASKIADSKFGTGKELISRKIKQAWSETISDLSFDGFQFKKIACESTFNGKSNAVVDIDGAGEIKIKKQKRILTSIQFQSMTFSGVGEYHLNINDGETTFDYVGEDKSIKVNERFFGQNITISIQYENANVRSLASDSCCPCSGDYCNFTINANKDYGLSFAVQEICDYEAYLCRYADMIGQAVVYKAGALILTEMINSARVNDHNIVNSKDIWTRIAYLDSSMNLFQYDNQVIQSSTSEVLVKDGKYQQEIARLSQLIPIPKDPYCIACTSSFYAISIP